MSFTNLQVVDRNMGSLVNLMVPVESGKSRIYLLA
jgi:hypothetical protein